MSGAAADPEGPSPIAASTSASNGLVSLPLRDTAALWTACPPRATAREDSSLEESGGECQYDVRNVRPSSDEARRQGTRVGRRGWRSRRVAPRTPFTRTLGRLRPRRGLARACWLAGWPGASSLTSSPPLPRAPGARARSPLPADSYADWLPARASALCTLQAATPARLPLRITTLSAPPPAGLGPVPFIVSVCFDRNVDRISNISETFLRYFGRNA